MRAARWIQFTWSGLAALLFNPFTVRPGLERHPEYYVLFVWLYLAFSVMCLLRNSRVAWWLALLFPAVPVASLSQFAVMNLYLFVTMRRPYDRQPAIFLGFLAIYGGFVGPAWVNYYCLWRDRHRLGHVLFARTTANLAKDDATMFEAAQADEPGDSD